MKLVIFALGLMNWTASGRFLFLIAQKVQGTEKKSFIH